MAKAQSSVAARHKQINTGPIAVAQLQQLFSVLLGKALLKQIKARTPAKIHAGNQRSTVKLPGMRQVPAKVVYHIYHIYHIGCITWIAGNKGAHQLGSGQRRFQIVNQILAIFHTNRQTYQRIANTQLCAHLRGNTGVRHNGWMFHQRLNSP